MLRITKNWKFILIILFAGILNSCTHDEKESKNNPDTVISRKPREIPSEIKQQKLMTNNRLISEIGVGDIKLGMPFDNLLTIFPMDKVRKSTMDAGVDEEYEIELDEERYEIYTDEESYLVIRSNAGKITKIYVYDRDFKTKENLSAGSTFGKILDNYKIKECKGCESGGTNIFIKEYKNMIFCIDFDTEVDQIVEKNSIPRNAEIQYILVFSPEKK
jgi:hypothetical protein